MWYITLVSPWEGDDNEVEEIPTWQDLSKEQQSALLEEYSQVVGLLCGGVYEANTPEEAIQQALENSDLWAGGCVA